MKILMVFCIGLAILTVSHASEIVPNSHDVYDPNEWPKAELKLSQAATLKDVFDSGLRPYRFPGLENSVLEVKHLDLAILLDSGKRLPAIPVEWMHIKVFTDGELATIEAATPKLTLEQARQQMINWLPYGENDRTETDLDEYLAAVDADYLNYDDPYRGIAHGCGVGWNEPGFKTPGGGPKVGVGFRKTASQQQPLRLYFSASWGLNRPIRDRGGYRPHPIEPPPGYEDVDMTAPAKFGPNSMVDILRSKGVDIGDGKGGMPQDAYSSSIEGVRREIERTSQQPYDGRDFTREQSSNNSPWLSLLWIGALLLLLGLLFQWLRTRFAAE